MILAVISAIGLIGFGILIGRGCRVGGAATPQPEHTATVIVLRPRVDFTT